MLTPTATARSCLAWNHDFEKVLVRGIAGLRREVEETLDIGWRLLGSIPVAELRRINKELISRYFSEIMEDGVQTPFC